MIDGKPAATDSVFDGLVMLLKRTGDVSGKLASSELLYSMAYGYVGTERDYETIGGFFADGNMFFDASGKYIDITDGSFWVSDDIGADKAFTFSFSDSCCVKPHTHTYADGKCSGCDYVCPHNAANDREASYFEKAICSICHCEYGDFIKDTTAPTGEILIQDRTWWQTVLNTITFGLFYKEDAGVIITATDDSYSQPGFDETKHAVKIEYFIGDGALNEEAVASSKFRAYTMEKFIIYVRMEDNAEKCQSRSCSHPKCSKGGARN